MKLLKSYIVVVSLIVIMLCATAIYLKRAEAGTKILVGCSETCSPGCLMAHWVDEEEYDYYVLVRKSELDRLHHKIKELEKMVSAIRRAVSTHEKDDSILYYNVVSNATQAHKISGLSYTPGDE